MMESNIEIQRLDETRFSSMEAEWQKLLLESSSDPLFMSWHWMYHWWKQCSAPDKDELILLAAYDDENLVGIAPFFKTRVKLKYLLRSKRILLIGTNPQGLSTFRAEYLEIIAHPKYEYVIKKFYSYLVQNIDFDELYLQDIIHDSATFKYLDIIPGYRRKLGFGCTYSIDTSGSFESYLSNLGRNTRTKCYAHRKRLKKYGTTDIYVIKNSDLTLIFDLLVEFQKFRWGITRKDLLFKKKFLESISCGSNIEIRGVVLNFDDKPVACTLDLKTGDRVYNFQLAYEQDFGKNFSLGLLTLVYDADIYFHDTDVKCFDLLEGKGKKYNYKSHISKEGQKLLSINIIQSSTLSVMISVYDYFITRIQALKKFYSFEKNAISKIW